MNYTVTADGQYWIKGCEPKKEKKIRKSRKHTHGSPNKKGQKKDRQDDE